MNFNEMIESIEDAEHTLRCADALTNKIAKLLIGRLRKVTGYNILRSLKRELKNYNAHSGEWK